MYILFLIAGLFLAEPSHAQTGAVGSCSHGSIQNAARLPYDGVGYTKILRGRNRNYGTSLLVNFLEEMGRYVVYVFQWPQQRLQIGDMSQEVGGDISLHRSHENGLDVDIAYIRTSGTEQDPEYLRGFQYRAVSRGALHSDFDAEKNWVLINAMIDSGIVQRIFVDPVVKRKFCRMARDAGTLSTYAATLHRINGLYNHHDHFHVRLYCPTGDTTCTNLEEPTSGMGCGSIR